MNIHIDSWTNQIESDGLTIIKISSNRYAFNELVEDILSPSQFNKYISDVSFSFKLSKKNANKLISYAVNGFPESSAWSKENTRAYLSPINLTLL